MENQMNQKEQTKGMPKPCGDTEGVQVIRLKVRKGFTPTERMLQEARELNLDTKRKLRRIKKEKQEKEKLALIAYVLAMVSVAAVSCSIGIILGSVFSYWIG